MVPIKGIIDFFGLVGEIPSNYLLCDGTLGTPDLRGKFVVGTSVAYPAGDTGGSDEHSHVLDADEHDHNPLATHDCPGAGGIASATVSGGGVLTDMADVTGNTEITIALPPYYSMLKIMRNS